MQKTPLMEKDDVLLDVIKYKQMGSEIDKFEYHLDMANKALINLKIICRKAEEETGVKMKFI